MKLICHVVVLLLLSFSVFAWTDASFERISERSSYSELERSHSSDNYNSNYHSKDYSRSRSFEYEYDYEREWEDSSNWHYSTPYRYTYSRSYGRSPVRGCYGSKYRMFGC